MKVSRQWLEAFLRTPLNARDMAARLGMLGAPVDGIESSGAALAPFVVGLVLDVQPHPEADKVRVTQVDDGTGVIHTVVCGAPNVTAGKKYPFARLGTMMPAGFPIEKRKIRGIASEGMLCSARELQLGDDHDGLLTLSTDAAPGTPLLQVLDVGDDCLEIDVTPNRADLLGHKGVARELAASYGVAYRLPEIPGESQVDLPTPTRHGTSAAVGGITLAIEDTAGCPRFLGAVIKGVRVGPSPEWLQQRLRSVGARPINNIVDATNYCLLELNQPMHAYDADKLRGASISARSAAPRERVMTLDGVERTIPSAGLVIADAKGVVGIAGVMGGRDSEVTAATTRIFLECACFDPARVRRTRRGVGLSTDASHRFERGVDRWGAVDAFRRCIRLIITVAGGELEGETVDCFPEPTFPPRVFLRPARVQQVLGIELPWKDIEKHLVAIGATVVSKPHDGRIAVDVPGWRPDITSEIDLVEEIARLHGYENIPDDLRSYRPAERNDDSAWTAAKRVRTGLASLGLTEVATLPMVSSGGTAAARVSNPLSAEHGYLRAALLPSLTKQVEANWLASTGDVRLFEVGNVFGAPGKSGAPVEELHAAFVVTGGRAPAHWSDGGKRATWDRWDARALFERLVTLAHPSASVEVSGDRWVAKDGAGHEVGWCGRLDADAPAWAAPLLGGELRVSLHPIRPPEYSPLPTFPATPRDLALLVSLDQPVVQLVNVLMQRGKRHSLESASVIDEFRGKALPEGKRSVAIRLVFRNNERTLTDAEVDAAVGRLLTSLERELDVTLRTT